MLLAEKYSQFPFITLVALSELLQSYPSISVLYILIFFEFSNSPLIASAIVSLTLQINTNPLIPNKCFSYKQSTCFANSAQSSPLENVNWSPYYRMSRQIYAFLKKVLLISQHLQ